MRVLVFLYFIIVIFFSKQSLDELVAINISITKMDFDIRSGH